MSIQLSNMYANTKCTENAKCSNQIVSLIISFLDRSRTGFPIYCCVTICKIYKLLQTYTNINKLVTSVTQLFIKSLPYLNYFSRYVTTILVG